jgi:hypothetical protein
LLAALSGLLIRLLGLLTRLLLAAALLATTLGLAGSAGRPDFDYSRS